MKVVIDSNVLVTIVGRRSSFRFLWEAFITGGYSIVISEDVIKEYEEILQIHAAEDIGKVVMEIFVESPDVIFQTIHYKWNAITSDPDDNKFFDLAVAAGVDYLVTNDAHFNRVRFLEFPKVNVINSDQFLEIVKNIK